MIQKRLAALAACLLLAGYAATARPLPAQAAVLAPDTSWVPRSAI
jgi:hypothetical protein